MAIVKKSFNESAVLSRIRGMGIDTRQKELLINLFTGDLDNSSRCLKSFPSSRWYDPDTILLATGILVCGFKNALASIRGRGLEDAMVRMFAKMGLGKGAQAKSFVRESPFKDVVKEILGDRATDSEKDAIVRQIESRIGGISEWTFSADKVTNLVMPILEVVLSSRIYTSFSASFASRRDCDEMKYILPIGCGDVGDVLSKNIDERLYLLNEKVFDPDFKENCKRIINDISGEEPEYWTFVELFSICTMKRKFLQTHCREVERNYDNSILSLYFDTLGTPKRVQLFLVEQDILRCLREVNGNLDKLRDVVLARMEQPLRNLGKQLRREFAANRHRERK